MPADDKSDKYGETSAGREAPPPAEVSGNENVEELRKQEAERAEEARQADEKLRVRLAAAGIRDLDAALSAIHALEADSFSRRHFSAVLEQALDALPRLADPDMALRNFDRFARASLDRSALFAQLAAHPALGGFLLSLLSFSEFLADILIRNPEYFEWLLEPGRIDADMSREDYRAHLRTSLAPFRRPETIRRAVCRWKRRHLLRIGVRDLLGKADVRQLGRELTYLAEAVIETALEQAEAECIARWGRPLALRDTDAEEDSGADSEARTGDSNAPGPSAGIAPCTPPARASFAVIGMGKLGGEDLNFSSDIDLVFVYSDEGQTEGVRELSGEITHQITNHEYFTKLGERLIAFLCEPSEEGLLFRVDMRLRPEGKTGPLARSIDSLCAYLAEQARPWERVAYLKARCVARTRSLPGNQGENLGRDVQSTGNLGQDAQATSNLGRKATLEHQFDKAAAYFVYMPGDAAGLVEEIARLKQRIDREVLEGNERERDVKRGIGGIREIEFIVSLRQILAGGANPALRCRPTLGALDLLESQGIFPSGDAESLRRAYILFRRLEHRLQMMAERQTYLLPADADGWGRLARRCGYCEGTLDEAGARLRQEYETRAGEVHALFRQTFHLAPRDTPPPMTAPEVLLGAGVETDPRPAIQILESRGFFDPFASLRALRELAFGTSELAISSRGQRGFEVILPALLESAPRLPDPDGAVLRLGHFLRATQGISIAYLMLAEYPPLLRMLLQAFGNGGGPARSLIAHPEWLDELIESGVVARGFDVAAMEPEVRRRVLAARDDAEAWRRLRLWKEKTYLITILIEVLGLERVERLARLTTDLAEVCLRAAAARVVRRLEAELGDGPPLPEDGAARNAPLRWTLLGLGGFGGAQVSHFSDLDIVLIYSGEGRAPGPEGRSASYWFSRLGEEIISIFSEITPEGQLFKMDARLRPEGRSAPLAASLARYIAYYEGPAQTWEWQAALKARHVAGDEDLAAQFFEAIHERLPARFPDSGALAAEVRSMRERLARAVKIPSWAEADYKRGAGGLTDIEFIVQYLQLRHARELNAHERRALLTPLLGEALERLVEAGALDSETARALREEHDFLRVLQRRQRLLFETSRDFFPSASAAPEKLEPLRRALAPVLAEGEDLIERRRQSARRVADLFDRLVI